MGSAAESYDYIIVGGGTAGLTVADRLSEDAEVKVLVIEAGQDHSKNPLVLCPGLVGGMYGKPEYDWNFNSVPQPLLNNRKINGPRGKQLGGSSAVNFMMLLYPSRGSIDAWHALGNKGWDYDSLAPYLRKFATVHAPSQAAKDVVGLTYHDDSAVGEGPVQVTFSEGYGKLNSYWMESFGKLGMEITSDVRTGKGLGAFQQPASIDPVTKTRSFAVTAHYSAEIASRPNLTVLTETMVKKITFDSTGAEPVATGVLVENKDGEQAVHGSEVILAAGALMSPQVLELSGVGSKALLEGLGIPVLIDNPSVGENLQDHPLASQSFEVHPDVPSSDVLRDPNVLNALIAMFQDGGKGPLGQSNMSVAYAPLVDGEKVCSEGERRDLIASYEGHTQTPDGKVLRRLIESPDEPTAEYILFPGQANTVLSEPGSMADYLAPTNPENYLTVMTLLNHPFSRGSVHITSRDVHKLPEWNPNFMSHPLDVEIHARHVQFAEQLISTAPFSEFFKPNGATIPKVRADSLENAKEVMRQTLVGDFHPAGSCAMKPKEQGGVVDDRLRLYGAKGVRIVDASVFPLEPLGNIQSVVYAVAEKAADLIKEDRKTKA